MNTPNDICRSCYGSGCEICSMVECDQPELYFKIVSRHPHDTNEHEVVLRWFDSNDKPVIEHSMPDVVVCRHDLVYDKDDASLQYYLEQHFCEIDGCFCLPDFYTTEQLDELYSNFKQTLKY